MQNRLVVRPSILRAGVVTLLFICAWSVLGWYNAKTQHVANGEVVAEITQPETGERAGSMLVQFSSERAAVAAILTKADKIEPFLIEPIVPLARGDIEGYKVVLKGKRLNSELAQSLTTIVLDSKSYMFSEASKMCLFQPRVAFRVWRGQQFVDTLICFDCFQLQFVIPNNEDSSHPTFASGWYDIDPAGLKLMELIRQVFPKTTELDRALNLRPRV